MCCLYFLSIGPKTFEMTSVKRTHVEQLIGSDHYGTWAFTMQSLLEFHDLENCIESSTTNPAIAKESAPDKLKKAKARIIMAIDKSLIVHIQQCTPAIEIWAKLKSMYEDNELARRITLLRQLISCNFANCRSMDEYINSVIGAA